MVRLSRAVLCLLSVGVIACQPIQASPSHASLFGQTTVSFRGDFSKLGTIQTVTVGGNRIYDLDGGPEVITGTLQGAENSGPAEVDVVGDKGHLNAPGAFTYDPPLAHVPRKWVAFGASLTMGFQSLGLSSHSQTHSGAADVARAAGVYLGLPLFEPTAIPELETTNFNPQCHQTSSPPALGSYVIMDPVAARVDPTLSALRNLAVGGSTVSDVLNGGVEPAVALQENIVEDPSIAGVDVFNQPGESQIDRIVALDPDVGLSTDLLANDVDGSVVQPDDLAPDLVTPVSVVAPLLNTMMARLGKLHGQFFIATLPYLTFIPGVVELRATRLASGMDTAASFDAKIQAINTGTDQLNAALVAAMAPYPNLHVVDFHSEAMQELTQGIVVNGQTLTVAQFGGLLSFDGLHFSDTGYGLLANLFIDAMNPVLGTEIPHVDLAALLAQDPYSPTTLRAAGFSCTTGQ